MTPLDEFFSVILKGESKTFDDHNFYTTGKKLNSFVKGKYGVPYSLIKNNLTSKTLGEVKNFQSRSRDNVGQLWATGRYQIIPDTLKEIQSSLNLSDNTKYDTITQKKMGLQLLKRRNDLKKYIQSSVPDTQQNLEKASLDIAKIWSSVGVPYAMKGAKKSIQKNESYYSGGGDKASVKTEDVQKALRKFRQNYSEEIDDTEDDELSEPSDDGQKKKLVKKIIAVGIAVTILGVSGTLIYFYLKKRGKLPIFMQKFNI